MFSKSKPNVVVEDESETTAEIARQRLAGLRKRLGNMTAERDRLAALRWATDTAREGEMDSAAEVLLASPDAEIAIVDIDERLRKLNTEIPVVERAVALARQEVAEHNRSVANKVARELRPAHRAAIKKIAHALTLLEEANREEQAVRARVPGNGSGLPAASFPNIGGRRIECSPAYWWWRFVRQHNLLDETEQPAMPMAAE